LHQDKNIQVMDFREHARDARRLPPLHPGGTPEMIHP